MAAMTATTTVITPNVPINQLTTSMAVRITEHAERSRQKIHQRISRTGPIV